jgi:rhomboid protease GluP
MSLCAGASGAIFGMLGGLLAYLVIRHRDVPAAILRPMRSGTIAFLGYNVIFGLTNRKIDMAGHLGGLATGFAVGLLLAGGWATRGGRAGLLHRLGAIAALSLGMTLLAHQAIGFARERILADPEQRAEIEAAPAWNNFENALAPFTTEFDRIGRGINQVLDDLDRAGDPTRPIGPSLDSLITASDSLGRRVAGLPAGNAEIRAMSAIVASGQKRQAHVLGLLKRFIADGNAAILDGPEGLKASDVAFKKDFEEFARLREAYFKAHGLTVAKDEKP